MKISEQNTNRNLINSNNRKIALITRTGDIFSVYNDEGDLLHKNKDFKQTLVYNEDFICTTNNKYKGRYKMQILDYDFAILQTRYTKFRDFDYVFEESHYFFPLLIHQLDYKKAIASYEKIDKNNTAQLAVSCKALFATWYTQILSIAKSYQVPFSLLRTDLIYPNYDKNSLNALLFDAMKPRIIEDLKNNTTQFNETATWYIRQIILKYKATHE